MLMACPRNRWEDSLPQNSSRRPLLAENWLKGSTTWAPPFLTRIQRYMEAAELYSWRAMMMTRQRRSADLRKNLVMHPSNLAGFQKADCWYRRVGIAGGN